MDRGGASLSGGLIDHILLDVADLERSEAFYGEAIGLPATGRDLWPGDGPSATFELGDGIHLVLVEVAEVRPDPPSMHTRLAVPFEEWDPIVERLRALGHRLHDDRKGGLRAVGEAGLNVTDPDGHVLELELHGPATLETPSARRGKIVAGHIDDFAIGSVTRVAEGQFFLLRLADGFLALSQVCTHMQFAITYQPEHFRFYCPRHRRRFTRTGRYMPRFRLDETPPLRTYPIEYVNGQVVVDTDESIPRTENEVDELVPCELGGLGASAPTSMGRRAPR
jgi:catechol 2,3-dioxygenase-like lactoylglutathione lyase family enzyme/nitrite reductase/ring-hydroxylating ferredoxin subunit